MRSPGKEPEKEANNSSVNVPENRSGKAPQIAGESTSLKDMPGRFRRILAYICEAFPPVVHFVFGTAVFGLAYVCLHVLSENQPVTVTWRAIGGAATLILFLLLMRVYDELKDVETDLALGREKDPKYVDRPIVRGSITVPDLVSLRWTVTVLLFGINLPMGYPLPLFAFLGLFLYSWLSFKWFFCKAISRSLLYAFLTHNPLSLALFGYILAVFVADFGWKMRVEQLAAPALAVWLPFVAWEISRKIRLPKEETSYPTYSKIFGRTTAILLPLALILIAAASLLLVFFRFSSNPVFPAIVGCLVLILFVTGLKSLLFPSKESRLMQISVEAYMVISAISFIVAASTESGIILELR